MRKVLEDQENLEIKQMEVTEILAEDGLTEKNQLQESELIPVPHIAAERSYCAPEPI